MTTKNIEEKRDDKLEETISNENKFTTKIPKFLKPKTLAAKIILISILVVVGIGLAIGVSYAVWLNSPNYTYYEISQALINSDYDKFSKNSDNDKIAESLKKYNTTYSRVINLTNSKFDDKSFKLFSAQVSKDNLAKDMQSSFSEKLKKNSDEVYSVNVSFSYLSSLSLNLPIELKITKQNGKWKLTDINMELLETLTGSTKVSTKEEEKEYKQFTIKFGETQELPNLAKVGIQKVESKDIFTKTRTGFSKNTVIELKPANTDNMIVRVIYTVENAGKEPKSFYDTYGYRFSTKEDVKYKVLDNIENAYQFALTKEELLPGYKLLSGELNPGEKAMKDLYFEVPKTVDMSGAYIEYKYDKNSYTSDAKSAESFIAKFLLQ